MNTPGRCDLDPHTPLLSDRVNLARFESSAIHPATGEDKHPRAPDEETLNRCWVSIDHLLICVGSTVTIVKR